MCGPFMGASATCRHGWGFCFESVCAHVGEHAFKVTQALTERGGACYCACQAPVGDLPKLGAYNRFLGPAHDLKARILRAEGAEICFFNKFSCGFQV